jgi:hypothetical protein
MDSIPRNPSSYLGKFVNVHLRNYDLEQYLEEYYNVTDIDVFQIEDYQRFKFMKRIWTDYEQQILLPLMEDMSVAETSGNNNLSLMEEDTRARLHDLLFS